MNLVLGEIIKGAIKPVTDLIDKLHTSAEEKLKLQIELEQAQQVMQKEILDHEAQSEQAAKEVILAEANGKSWMQRNWRPSTMFCFVAILAYNYIVMPIFSGIWPNSFKVLEFPDQFWTLLIVGIGGYLGARSLEKVAPNLKRK